MDKTKNLILIFFCIVIFSCKQAVVRIDDSDGILAKENTPVLIEIELTQNQKIAAIEGRLGLMDLSSDSNKGHLIPVQMEDMGKGLDSRIVMLMPGGDPGLRKFRLIESETSFNEAVRINRDSENGQFIIAEAGKKILQYNYQTVYEKDVLRLDSEKLEEHIRTETDTFVTVSIYAVPRSNYIHPLYGLVAWVQPTFPAQGTRYPLSTEKPLILRYRLIVYTGDKPDKNVSKNRWDAFHTTVTPLFAFN